MTRDRAEYYKTYYEKNKDKKLEKQKVRGKQYREENKETIKQKSKKYYESNKEQISKKTSKRRYEQYHSNPEQALQKQKEWKINNLEKYLVQGAKQRAKKYGLPFDITYKDIVIPEFCPYLGIKLIPFSEWSSPSLDKIIPELGYIKGNIQVISTKANTMKNNATQTELIRFATAVLAIDADRML
jgi:actin-related protein